MIGKLNHVGIATPSIEALGRDAFRACRAPPRSARSSPCPTRWVASSCAEQPDRAIEPYGDASPLKPDPPEKESGGGQHHICFEVPDIIAARRHGGQGRDGSERRTPRIGAHGTPVILHPENMGGVPSN